MIAPRALARSAVLLTLLLAALGLLTAPAQASHEPACPGPEAFGLCGLDFLFTDPEGLPATQAGSHPFAMTTTLGANLDEATGLPYEEVKDLEVGLPAGLVGSTAIPRCSNLDFFSDLVAGASNCPDDTVVGTVDLTIFLAGSPGATTGTGAVYNLEPPPGVAAKLGFNAAGVRVVVEATVNPNPPYNIIARVSGVTQGVYFLGSSLTVWGVPADPGHDEERGFECLESPEPDKCPVKAAEEPLLTMPRSCTGPLLTSFRTRSWQDPGAWLTYEVESHTADEPPVPLGTGGCEVLRFAPEIATAPTTDAAESPTGLAFDLRVEDPNLTSPAAIAHSDIQKAVVTLPEGVTINPSQAEGLATCSEAQLAKETASSPFGAGCPPDSKIGTVEVESPLAKEEVLRGSLFVAEPYSNRFGSLLAIYQVIKGPELGVVFRLAGKVEPDPRTGQLITTFEDLPQWPFSEFRLRFREGGRSPLITPPACGTYVTEALFTPWADPDSPYPTTASFPITAGVGGGPCPPAGPSPFAPGFSAGALNNNAKSFSPFHLRLTRRDGDQDLVRFDATLPPGAVAKLAGVAKCPEAAIAAIKTKTGKQELANPSCPADSRIGSVFAGAGVGSQLTYVPGSVYLAGPVGKAPLSVVGVVPAVAGPFDVGVVATRQALTLDPITAQPRVDGALSEPIPHILAGIPLRVRDIQVAVDRPDFTLNPTNCEPMAVGASIWGGGLDPFSTADDAPVAKKERFQAANCSRLGFKPRLSLSLKGGAKRGGHPALRALLRPRPADANLKRTVVRLPRSAFLDQAHIRTICTRVQFAADSCPPGSVYGHVKAFSPLLDEPLEGPAYLRSSSNELPDLVFDLHGIVEIEASARIDSIKGGIRATFSAIPDAPVSKVIVDMQGGKKGLIVNSRNLCAAPSRASVKLGAHNGRQHNLRPAVQAKGCGRRG
jgi:hypothetical protein